MNIILNYEIIYDFQKLFSDYLRKFSVKFIDLSYFKIIATFFNVQL